MMCVCAIFNMLYNKKTKKKTTEICQSYNIILLLYSSSCLNFLATNSIKTLINCLDLTAPLLTRCWHTVNGHQVYVRLWAWVAVCMCVCCRLLSPQFCDYLTNNDIHICMKTKHDSVSDIDRRLIVRHVRLLPIIEKSSKGKFEKSMELPLIQAIIIAAAQIGIIRTQFVRINRIEIGRICWMLNFWYIRCLLFSHICKIDAFEELMRLHLVHTLAQPFIGRSAQSSYEISCLA